MCRIFLVLSFLKRHLLTSKPEAINCVRLIKQTHPLLGSGGYGASMATPDMDDVKESVRQGVTKVAGKLSGMASGVMTQLQVS